MEAPVPCIRSSGLHTQLIYHQHIAFLIIPLVCGFVQGYFRISHCVVALYMDEGIRVQRFFMPCVRAAGVHHFNDTVFWVRRFSIPAARSLRSVLHLEWKMSPFIDSLPATYTAGRQCRSPFSLPPRREDLFGRLPRRKGIGPLRRG